MKKKIYKAPTTELVAFATEPVMADVSLAGDSMDFDQTNRSRGHSHRWIDDEEE